MERLAEILVSSLAQLGVVALVAGAVFGLRRIYAPRFARESFFDFVGLRWPVGQLDRVFGGLLLLMIAFALLSVGLQFRYDPVLRNFLLGELSPYGKILRDGFGPIPLFSGVLYCLVQSAAAEELLFRGLIGRRLIRWLGFARGNLLQALVFWSMHLLIFRWVFGTWISWIQLYAFVASFGLGWLGGYLNERGDGRSIAPSWMLHGLSNLATFLALAALRG